MAFEAMVPMLLPQIFDIPPKSTPPLAFPVLGKRLHPGLSNDRRHIYKRQTETRGEDGVKTEAEKEVTQLQIPETPGVLAAIRS